MKWDNWNNLSDKNLQIAQTVSVVFLFLLFMIVGLSLMCGSWTLPIRPSDSSAGYELRLTQVADCQSREQFTTAQCVILVGGE